MAAEPACSSSPPGESKPSSLRLPVLGAALVLILLVANLPVLRHQWVYFDDDINILLNPHLTGGEWDSIRWAWTDLDYTRRYIPVGWMMFDFLFRLGGLNQVVYHLASWLLAATGGLVLFVAVGRCPNLLAISKNAAWRDWSVFFSVILLSVHPLHAEIVGWASGLLYLLALLFAWMAVAINWGPAGIAPGRRRRVLRSAVALGLFVLSLLTYPVLLSLPLLLMLAEATVPADPRPHWILRLRAALLRYAGWLIAAIIIGLLNAYAAARAQLIHSGWASGAPFSITHQIPLALRAIHYYLLRLFWPDLTGPLTGNWREIAAFALLVGTGVLLLCFRRTRGPLGAVVATGLLALAPFLAMVNRPLVANDRYTLLLLGGMAGVLAVFVAATPWRRTAAAGCIGAILCCWQPYQEALHVWYNTSTVQARVDACTVARGIPDSKLDFSRPAVIDFLSGKYALSLERLERGTRLCGETPDLADTREYIHEFRTGFQTPSGQGQMIMPYVALHLEFSRQQAARGHAWAAQAQKIYAYRLASGQADSPAADNH